MGFWWFLRWRPRIEHDFTTKPWDKPTILGTSLGSHNGDTQNGGSPTSNMTWLCLKMRDCLEVQLSLFKKGGYMIYGIPDTQKVCLFY